MSKTTAVILFILLSLCGQAAFAWTTVGTGIEYEKFTLSDPNNVYVSRMLRSEAAATIESSLPQGKLTGARETVRAQSNRLDDAINWWGGSWGQRNDVAVAINGDWVRLDTGLTHSGQVHSGWYAKQIYCEFGGSQFAWTQARVPFIGGSLSQATQSLTITYKSKSTTQSAQGVNRARGANELIIYTPQYDSDTNTDSSGVEVLVEVARPTGPIPLPGMTTGYVRKILQNQGSTPIPFDHVVLSAAGTAATVLLANVSVGSEIGISQLVITQETPAFNWSTTYASVGGGHVLVSNGTVIDNSSDPVMAARHPRTAVAYNSTYVFFVVCDGRSIVSRGMTALELGNFCKNTLGATYALNLDGGGSSTMVVNGSVVNVPSDGSERAVGNGLMMVNLQPKMQSATYCSGQYVSSTGSWNMRLGPGVNYASLGTTTSGAIGTVVPHSLNGLYAKGYYWWKSDFGGTVGWVAENGLVAHGSILPSVTQQPTAQTVCTGSTASFIVGAVGSGCLSYQWQKNGSNLVDGGKYSGVTTRVLTISGCSASETGAYRCIVGNLWGTANSDTAVLALNPPLTVSIGSPSAPVTKNGPVTFTVTYMNADAVSLSSVQVTLNKTGTANGAVSVSGSGTSSRTITVSSITGNGTVGVSLLTGTASNSCGLAGAAGPSDTCLVDNTAPSGSIIVNGGAQYTTSASVTLSLTGSDPNGVWMCFRNSISDPWSEWEAFAASRAWTLQSGDGTKIVYVMLKDAVGNTAVLGDMIALDSTAPVLSGAPTDAGTYISDTSVVFNWAAAYDSTSGIEGYNCCIGTSPGGSDVLSGFLGNVLSQSVTGSYGKIYYCRVQARDKAGNTSDWSDPSNGIAVVQHANVDITTAKSLADLATVGMSHKTVSAVFADYFYIQELSRTSGIRVCPVSMPPGLSIGSVIDVGGTLRIDSRGERYIEGVAVTQ